MKQRDIEREERELLTGKALMVEFGKEKVRVPLLTMSDSAVWAERYNENVDAINATPRQTEKIALACALVSAHSPAIFTDARLAKLNTLELMDLLERLYYEEAERPFDLARTRRGLPTNRDAMRMLPPERLQAILAASLVQSNAPPTNGEHLPLQSSGDTNSDNS